MIGEILTANVGKLIELEGLAGALAPEKAVFQLSVGRKTAEGWHLTVDGNAAPGVACLFHRGLYTGDVVIDWNDEYKYKEKSRRQILRETTPDYEVRFRDEDEFAAFVRQCGESAGRGKCRIPGKKRAGSRADTALFDAVLQRAFALQTDPSAAARLAADEAEVAVLRARQACLLLRSVPAAILILCKENDPAVAGFADTPRRSYFYETADRTLSAWLTVQNGIGKVTDGGGTRLSPYCGLTFASPEQVIEYRFTDAAGRAGLYEALYRGPALADGNEPDPRRRFLEITESAVARLCGESGKDRI